MKPSGAEADEPEIDIENEIQDEVRSMRKPQGKPLFTNVRIDVQCGKVADEQYTARCSPN